MRRVSRSAALHLSRCNRPPVVDREAAHEDALIIRGVKPRITGELPPPPPPLPPPVLSSRESRTWTRPRPPPPGMGARFVFLLSRARGHLSSSSTFWPRSLFLPRTALSVSGIPPVPLTGQRFCAAYYLSPSISHATKDVLVSAPHRPALRRAATIRGDLLRRAPTMGLSLVLERPFCSVAGAARSYRDSDRWISSIICGGISRDCQATVVSRGGGELHSRGTDT